MKIIKLILIIIHLNFIDLIFNSLIISSKLNFIFINKMNLKAFENSNMELLELFNFLFYHLNHLMN
jgi:hypothetical protein